VCGIDNATAHRQTAHICIPASIHNCKGILGLKYPVNTKLVLFTVKEDIFTKSRDIPKSRDMLTLTCLVGP
jgi:hypothetical protein